MEARSLFGWRPCRLRGNKYRLIIRTLYPSPKVFILSETTQEQCDHDKGKDACGCFAPSLKKPEKKTATKTKAKRKRKSRWRQQPFDSSKARSETITLT